MYVDWYRMNGGPKDNAPVCRDNMCDHHRNTGNFVPYHRVSSVGCSGYNDWITKRNTAPRSKHSPIPDGKGGTKKITNLPDFVKYRSGDISLIVPSNNSAPKQIEEKNEG